MKKILLGIALGGATIAAITGWVSGMSDIIYTVHTEDARAATIFGTILLGIIVYLVSAFAVDKKIGVGIFIGALIATIVVLSIVDKTGTIKLILVWTSPSLLGWLYGLATPEQKDTEKESIETQ